MKIKDFIDIAKNSVVVVSIRYKNEKTPKYYGDVAGIPASLLEYDILNIDDAIDMTTNTAALIIDIKENKEVKHMPSLKVVIKQGCTKTRVIRVKTENEVLYDGTAGNIPEELLEADWLVKMMEYDERPVLTITVIKGGL